jgi:CHAT domain-containing protein
MEKAVYAGGDSGRSRAVIDYYLNRLFQWLIEPLRLAENTSTVILMIDSLFAQIPFPALLDSSNVRLKDYYDIRVVINPEDLKHNHRRKSDGPVPSDSSVFIPDIPGLPFIETEGRAIKEIFPAVRLYRGGKADINHFRQELSRSRGFVHVATHAVRSSENPLFSRILMDDGPFFPFDLFGSGIKARLVTLSGCQTAAPGLYYGNSFSLAKIFYQGGADYVLASLWPISDKISMVFMVEFYRALKRHGGIAAAYWAAMEKTAKVNSHPSFWGAFVLLGL